MATDRELAARSMMQAGIGSLSGRPSRPQYETVGDEMRGEGFLETMSGKKIFPTQLNDWGMKNISYGLPATNQGYKVWNAGGPMDLWHYLKRFAPGYDPEQDSWRHEEYQKLLEQLKGKTDPLEGALPSVLDPRVEVNPWESTEGYGLPENIEKEWN